MDKIRGNGKLFSTMIGLVVCGFLAVIAMLLDGKIEAYGQTAADAENTAQDNKETLIGLSKDIYWQMKEFQQTLENMNQEAAERAKATVDSLRNNHEPEELDVSVVKEIIGDTLMQIIVTVPPLAPSTTFVKCFPDTTE